MEMQITEIYGEFKLKEAENQVVEAENKLARLIVLNDAAQHHESLSRRKALKDLRVIKLVDKAETENAKQLRGVQNQIAWEKKVILKNQRITRF